MYLHKRKDGGARWIYQNTIHGRRHEMGLGALRDIPLKQTRECATQWRSVLREDDTSLEKFIKGSEYKSRMVYALFIRTDLSHCCSLQ